MKYMKEWYIPPENYQAIIKRYEEGSGPLEGITIGAYDHKKVDTLLGVDGEEEFTVYLAPVGRVS